MRTLALDVLAALAGLALALGVCIYLIRKGTISRRHRGTLIAGAMLLGLGHVYMGAQQDTVQESKDETGRKKDAQSGEPPEPAD